MLYWGVRRGRDFRVYFFSFLFYLIWLLVWPYGLEYHGRGLIVGAMCSSYFLTIIREFQFHIITRDYCILWRRFILNTIWYNKCMWCVLNRIFSSKKKRARFDYKQIYNSFATIHYMTVYKTIHIYYLNKSHDLLNRSCD